MARKVVVPPAQGQRQPMDAAVASVVAAHPQPGDLRAQAQEFAKWASERAGNPVTPGEAGEAMESHRLALESELERARRNARLFTREGRLRPARYRHASEFCPACGRHKDYRKECGSCGHVEWTR